MSILKNSPVISSIGFSENKMFIELSTSRILTVPYTYTKKLNNATIEELKDYRLIGNGIGVHFNKIDEDLSVNGLIKDFHNDSKRINISIKANLLDEIDQYAESHDISRSALIQKATFSYIYNNI